jgi:hypothetical protein
MGSILYRTEQRGDVGELPVRRRMSTQLTRVSSITRVLRTSSGVVRAAAMPPATLPQAAASYAGKVL